MPRSHQDVRGFHVSRGRMSPDKQFCDASHFPNSGNSQFPLFDYGRLWLSTPNLNLLSPENLLITLDKHAQVVNIYQWNTSYYNPQSQYPTDNFNLAVEDSILRTAKSVCINKLEQKQTNKTPNPK